jgi:hypothetical protein
MTPDRAGSLFVAPLARRGPINLRGIEQQHRDALIRIASNRIAQSLPQRAHTETRHAELTKQASRQYIRRAPDRSGESLS